MIYISSKDVGILLGSPAKMVKKSPFGGDILQLKNSVWVFKPDRSEVAVEITQQAALGMLGISLEEYFELNRAAETITNLDGEYWPDELVDTINFKG